MADIRDIRPSQWRNVRGSEERDNTARFVEDSTSRSPWDFDNRNLDPSKISIYDSTEMQRTGKPRDALSGVNERVTSSSEFSMRNIWLRAGTVFFGVLSIGLILVLISRAMSLSNM